MYVVHYMNTQTQGLNTLCYHTWHRVTMRIHLKQYNSPGAIFITGHH